MTNHVFLSYSHTDTESMQAVRNAFVQAGLPVWTDEGIPSGTPSWQRAIENAIDTCFCIAVLLSTDAKGSEWIAREISYAQSLKKPFVALLLRGDEASAVPFSLSGIQYADLRKPTHYQKAISAVIDTLVRLQSEYPTIPTKILPVPTPPKPINLPTLVSLLDLYDARDIDMLDIYHRWLISREPQAADWLQVPIGVTANNSVRELNLRADADGVHALIAGVTGAGKSELLISLVLSLAIKYDPSIVNFVLIDPKGGGEFYPLRALPHVVDVVSALDKNAAERVFKAIRAELERRQQLLVATSSRDIIDYRQRGFGRLDNASYRDSFRRVNEPYPHLILVISEFLEIVDSDKNLEELHRIARLGRSLGVHLVLTATHPKDISDQLRANVKLRIALRTYTNEESTEVLRRRDAVSLPTTIPGRGYIQIGHDELELIQIAWTGNPYKDGITRDRLYGEDSRFYEVLIEKIASLASEQHSIVQKPWADPLPDMLVLSDKVPEAGRFLRQDDLDFLQNEMSRAGRSDISPTDLPLHPALKQWETIQPVEGLLPEVWKNRLGSDERALHPVIGIIDDAAANVQPLLVIPLLQGNTALFSASGWGKTTFLRTLILSLAAAHSPSELHIYALDFGSQGLLALSRLPHIGAILLTDEFKRLERFIQTLTEIINVRNYLFEEAGMRDFSRYNRAHPDEPLPAILVVIDRIAELTQTLDHLLEPFVRLLREGRPAGISFVATGEDSRAFGRLLNLFNERMTLFLANPDEYETILGHPVRPIEPILGRGYLSQRNSPLTFQLGVASSPEIDNALPSSIRSLSLVERMAETWAAAATPYTKLPEQIIVLPRILSFNKYLKDLSEAEAASLEGAQTALLGIEENRNPYTLIDFRRIQHFLISGQSQTGKTNAMRTMILSLALFNHPSDVAMVLVDPQRRLFDYGGSVNFLDLPHVIQGVTEPEEMRDVINHLKYESEQIPIEQGALIRHLFVFIDNYDDFEELGVEPAELAPLTRLKPNRPLIHFVVAGSDMRLKSQDDLTRRIYRDGLAMDNKTAQASPFNAILKKSLREAELPLGRGFVVRPGQTRMVQVANLTSSTDSPEKLDRYVLAAQNKAQLKAAWHPMDE